MTPPKVGFLNGFEFEVELQPRFEFDGIDDGFVVAQQLPNDLIIVDRRFVNGFDKPLEFFGRHVHNNPKTNKSEGIGFTVVDVQKSIGIFLLFVDFLEVHVVHQQKVTVEHEYRFVLSQAQLLADYHIHCA